MGVDVGNLTSTSTDTLKNKGTKVSVKDMQPGDMVFFDTYKKDGHVGIYIGNGKFIGAQSSTGVAVVDMNSKYWKDRFSGNVRRVTTGGSRADVSTIGQERASKSANVPKSSYTNTYKTKKEALNAPGYQSYKGSLSQAVQAGKVPIEWVAPLTELIGRESTWNHNADNGSHKGYGQFSADNIKTYEKKSGMSYSNPVGQIVMTAMYIKDRYGTPEKALQKWDSRSPHWY